jgi:hypothetical protein
MHGAPIAGTSPARTPIVFLAGPKDQGADGRHEHENDLRGGADVHDNRAAVDGYRRRPSNGIVCAAGTEARPAGVQSKGSGIL